MSIKKWRLTSKKDISPSSWFPLEQRSYKLPNGKIVDDFYVTTLEDSVHVVPITRSGQIVLIRMYKQGIDQIMLQFPAGRFEPKKHSSLLEAAAAELEEETGIAHSTSKLEYLGAIAASSTKATEKVHAYLATDVDFNSTQNLDEHEEIEILQVTPKELDHMIVSGDVWDSHCLAIWSLVKLKYSQITQHQT